MSSIENHPRLKTPSLETSGRPVARPENTCLTTWPRRNTTSTTAWGCAHPHAPGSGVVRKSGDLRINWLTLFRRASQN